MREFFYCGEVYCLYNSLYLFYFKLQVYLNEDVSSALGKVSAVVSS